MYRKIGLTGLLALAVSLSMCCWMVAAALALPEGRVYEMVSPTYKGGYGVERIQAVAPNAESVAFFSKGAFGGIPSGELPIDYLASRGTSSWSTAPATAPSAMMPNVENQDISSTLGMVLEFGTLGPNEARAYHGTEEEFLIHSSTSPDTASGAEWEVAGEKVIETLEKKEAVAAIYKGGSSDFCHLLFGDAAGPLVPEAAHATDPQGLVYELDRGCSGEAVSIRVLGLDNQQKLMSTSCPEAVGEEYPGGTRSGFNAISRDGGEIFFETNVEETCSDHQLFVELDGARAIEVSKPLGECQEIPCEGASTRQSATFVGASENGAHVFFTTQAALVSGHSDPSLNLYMATIGCPSGGEGDACIAAGEASQMQVTSLVDVSNDPHAGPEAAVKGVVRVAPDGSRAYFVASGDLLSEPEQEADEREGHAVPAVGADNLYVYGDGTTNRIGFVASLCSGPNQSGSAYDPRCPSKSGSDEKLWEGELGEAQTAGAGAEFLVFSTYAQLVGSDTDNAKDVYRYDVGNNSLVRVSHGEDGNDDNGNCNEGSEEAKCNATIQTGHWGGEVRNQYEMDNRAVSEDGSRIVFTTEQALSPAASNGLANVYEWLGGPGEGSVSLISSGTGEPVKDVVISPQGNDIFFVTSESLVPQDTDEVPDIYDARVNGGFAPPLVSSEPCEGEACYGPLTNPAPLLVPGSVSQAPAENVPGSRPVASSKPKKKNKAKKAGHKAKKSTKHKAKKAGGSVRKGRKRRRS